MHTYTPISRTRRLAVAAAVMALVAIGVPVPSAAFPTKGKIIELGASKRYSLSVGGTFSLTSGEAVESGTLSAPTIFIKRLPNGKAFTWSGTANGRVTNELSAGPGCKLDGTIILGMFVTGPAMRVPATTVPQPDELASLYPTPVIPVGYVGISVYGAAVSGMKSKQCSFGGRPEDTVTMGGLAVTTALAMASNDTLIFPRAGGAIERVGTGNPSYRFTYKLKKA